MVPEGRVRVLGDGALREDGDYVLYWMVANRRAAWNFSLDRALERCAEFGKPLLVLEALRCGYPWASDRIHAFVLQGMADNKAAFEHPSVRYLAYVEPEAGAGSGLLEALAARACVVVTDDFPCFFIPRMLEAAASKLELRLEAVDSNGLYPLRDTPRVFTVAHSFRRHLQKRLKPHLSQLPNATPLAGLSLPKAPAVSRDILSRWPEATAGMLRAEELGGLPIEHGVGVVEGCRGGREEGLEVLGEFVSRRLGRYVAERNDPDAGVASGLSPYLHFGHVSVHEVFAAVAEREGWGLEDVAEAATGKREGWWGMSEVSEGFLDELVTWREIGFNFCSKREDYDELGSLPGWALETIDAHRGDEREWVYSLEELEAGRTHDELWNAAQRELRETGRIHNYLRMLWGKKIYEWSATPEDALAALIELNNKYALDGRNPNSYSGIFWVLGRYDRAWGPERPIYGKLRYMASKNTRKKVALAGYLERFGG